MRTHLFKAMPCTAVQKTAYAASLDGDVPAATTDLARVGRHNAARDFMRLCKRRLSFMQHVQIYQVPMPFIRRDELGVEIRRVGLLLPHEIWAGLYECKRDDWLKIFGNPDQCRECWRRSASEPWFHDHPARHVPDAVPLRLHGDDAQHKKGLVGLAIMVLSWGSPLSCFVSSIDSLLLIMTQPLLHLTGETLQKLYAIIAWSFNVIAAGTWPHCDHNGQAWPADSMQARKAGHPLAGGVRGFVIEILGDWKWIKESFKLQQHYNAMDCCHLCFATKGSGVFNFARFHPDAYGQRPRRTTQAYTQSFLPGQPPALSQIIGFCILMLLVDFMHSDHQGVSSWTSANCLLELCLEGVFGTHAGDWQTRTNRSLRRAWLSFKTWAKDCKRGHSQRTFTCAMLSVGSGEHYFPAFKGKAHNTSVVMRWVHHVVTEQLARLETPNRHQRVRATMLWSHIAIFDIMEVGDIWLDDAQAKRLLYHGETMLMAYSTLSREAHLRGKARWGLKPKHHHLFEGLHWAKLSRRNPRATWLYKHEDMVGRAARTAAQTHPSTTSIITLERWLLRWALKGPRSKQVPRQKRRSRRTR